MLKDHPNITPQEWGRLKGAIRRQFSRSELRKRVIEKTILRDHVDKSRPKVKTWCACEICKTPTPKSYMECDHKSPVVPIGKEFKDMDLEEFIALVWCNEDMLQGICPDCHSQKSSIEREQRKALKPKKTKGKQK